MLGSVLSFAQHEVSQSVFTSIQEGWYNYFPGESRLTEVEQLAQVIASKSQSQNMNPDLSDSSVHTLDWIPG